MTCIVGLVEDGHVWMGGDSLSSSGYDKAIVTNPKVFHIMPWFMIGFTTSWRMGQLLQYRFAPPDPSQVDDPARYMVTDFVDAVRDCFRQGGLLHKEHDVETGGQFLVGFRQRLYCISNDFQVASTLREFDAVGAGSAYALGSLHETEHHPPQERIARALEAAARFSVYVAPPFTVAVL
jgi:ATP-dependent protease HslVU (ClpYQ) peptidase subunit